MLKRAGHHRLFRITPPLFLIGGLLIWLGLGLGWLGQPSPAHGQAPTPVYTLYLPLVARDPCAPLTPQEQAILDRLSDHPDQKRPDLRCDPILQRVARERALDMGQRNYFNHVNPDGYGPNALVRQAGYPLPDWYGQEPRANNIESIAYYCTANPPSDWGIERVWDNWMNSPGHREHLLGLADFYAAQTDYGIGYANVPGEGCTYRSYWVVITAQRGP